MSHGTTFKSDIILPGEHFRSPDEVEDALIECEGDIRDVKNEIGMYFAASPDHLKIPDEHDTISFLKMQLDYLLGELLRLDRRRDNLQRLQHYLEYEDGDLEKLNY